MDLTQIKQYMYSSLGTLFWSAFLLAGGAVFLSYYAYIGYMPDFDFKSAATLLAAASITSILIIALFMVLLILPGMYWSETWADGSCLKASWQDGRGKKMLSKVVLWFGVPIIIFYGGLLTAAIAPVPVPIAYFVLVCVSIYLFFYYAKGLHGSTLHVEVWWMIGTSFVSSMLAFAPSYIIAVLATSGTSVSKGAPGWVGLVGAVAIAFVNVLAAVRPGSVRGLLYYGGLGFAGFWILFSSFEIFHRVPERVMQIYKFGAFKAESIVFDGNVCKALSVHGLLEEDLDSSLCSLDEVSVLSRLGGEFYIEKDDIRLTVPSSEVISWSIKADRD